MPKLARSDCKSQVSDVGPVEQDGSRGRVVEAGNQVHQRRLARSRGPHDGDRLAGLDGQVDAVEHLGPGFVAKAHASQLDAALRGGHIQRAGLVGDFDGHVQDGEDALTAGKGRLHV